MVTARLKIIGRGEWRDSGERVIKSLDGRIKDILF